MKKTKGIENVTDNMFLDVQEIRKLMINGVTIVQRDNIYTSERELNYLLESEILFEQDDIKMNIRKLPYNMIYGKYSPSIGIDVLDTTSTNSETKAKNRQYKKLYYDRKSIDPLDSNKEITKQIEVQTLNDIMKLFKMQKYEGTQLILLCSDIESLLNHESWHQIKILVAKEYVNFIFLATELSKFPEYIKRSSYITNHNRIFENWRFRQIECINIFKAAANNINISNNDKWYHKTINQLVHINADMLESLIRNLEIHRKDIKYHMKFKEITIKDNADNENALTKSAIVKQTRDVEPLDISSFKQIIDKFLYDYWNNISILSNLEYEPSNSVDINDLGGYDRIKQDAEIWRSIFKYKDVATATNTPIPKAILLQGPQGTGKTTIAKAIANKIDSKFITFNIANQFGSLLGETESNIKNTLQTLKTMAPAVVLIDEADKVLVGKNASGQSDSGTTSRALQNLSSFMAEEHPGIFFIFTANDATKIPPEFMRAGRMDEIYFVDLPDNAIKKSILKIHMKKLGYGKEVIDAYITKRIEDFMKVTDLMTGSEIENALKKTRMKHFKNIVNDNEKDDIILKLNGDMPYKIFEKILKETTPIAATCKAEIDLLIKWGEDFAVNANKK